MVCHCERQRSNLISLHTKGLLRRFTPRNDSMDCNINWNPVTYNGTLNKDGTKAEGLGWGFIWSMKKK